jgi:hypothetical protein
MADTLMVENPLSHKTVLDVPEAEGTIRGRVPEPEPSPLPNPEPVPSPEPLPQPPSAGAY